MSVMVHGLQHEVLQGGLKELKSSRNMVFARLLGVGEAFSTFSVLQRGAHPFGRVVPFAPRDLPFCLL